jgi:hypothetical protein
MKDFNEVDRILGIKVRKYSEGFARKYQEYIYQFMFFYQGIPMCVSNQLKNYLMNVSLLISGCYIIFYI